MAHSSLYDRTLDAVNYLNPKLKFGTPELAIFVGTGSSAIVDKMDKVYASIKYEDIPNLKNATVSSHNNVLIYGSLYGHNVLIWTGRLHYYEGHSMDEVTFPVRITGLLKVDKLIFINASGGLNTNYKSGDLVFVQDHINLFPENPLRGDYDDRWGPRFPDLSEIYHPKWNQLGLEICAENNIVSHAGTYVGLQGPSLESPAEYKYLRSIGADLVGMSTIPDILVAQQMGLDKIIISIISNVVDQHGKAKNKTTVESVIQTVGHSLDRINTVVEALLSQILSKKQPL